MIGIQSFIGSRCDRCNVAQYCGTAVSSTRLCKAKEMKKERERKEDNDEEIPGLHNINNIRRIVTDENLEKTTY